MTRFYDPFECPMKFISHHFLLHNFLHSLYAKREEKTAQEGFAIKVPVLVEQSPEKIGIGLLQGK